MELNSTPFSLFPRPCLWQSAVARAPSSKQVCDSRPVYVGFVVDKVTLGEIYSPVLLFLVVRIIPPVSVFIYV